MTRTSGNVFLDGDRRPALTDWQLVQHGHWSIDVGYHIASALEPGERAAAERDLLAHYLDRLRAEGVDAPTFDAAWLEYRRGVVYGFYLWAITLFVQPDIIEALLHRLGSAARTSSRTRPRRTCEETLGPGILPGPECSAWIASGQGANVVVGGRVVVGAPSSSFGTNSTSTFFTKTFVLSVGAFVLVDRDRATEHVVLVVLEVADAGVVSPRQGLVDRLLVVTDFRDRVGSHVDRRRTPVPTRSSARTRIPS